LVIALLLAIPSPRRSQSDSTLPPSIEQLRDAAPAIVAAAIVISIVIAGLLVVLRSDPATPTRDAVPSVTQGVATAVVPEAPYGRGSAKEGSALAPGGAVSWSAESTGRSPQQR